jgi:hypothetical protein
LQTAAQRVRLNLLVGRSRRSALYIRPKATDRAQSLFVLFSLFYFGLWAARPPAGVRMCVWMRLGSSNSAFSSTPWPRSNHARKSIMPCARRPSPTPTPSPPAFSYQIFYSANRVAGSPFLGPATWKPEGFDCGACRTTGHSARPCLRVSGVQHGLTEKGFPSRCYTHGKDKCMTSRAAGWLAGWSTDRFPHLHMGMKIRKRKEKIETCARFCPFTFMLVYSGRFYYSLLFLDSSSTFVLSYSLLYPTLSTARFGVVVHF